MKMNKNQYDSLVKRGFKSRRVNNQSDWTDTILNGNSITDFNHLSAANIASNVDSVDLKDNNITKKDWISGVKDAIEHSMWEYLDDNDLNESVISFDEAFTGVQLTVSDAKKIAAVTKAADINMIV